MKSLLKEFTAESVATFEFDSDDVISKRDIVPCRSKHHVISNWTNHAR